MPDRELTAMLDCEDGEKDRNSDCRHCKAGVEESSGSGRYWDIQLDQDLLETICGIYPEWFKDCNMNDGMCLLATNNANKQDNGRLLDKNKESLKVKLMLRRPLNQLVDQGILPSLKSPPAFHEQRQKLERAKMGDILKHKLQKRPDRQELIQQHILEDSSVDSSLQDKQKQLKKARLADALNGMISQRPGSLDLVKGNMLNSEELLAQAVRESSIPFKSPCGTPSPKVRSLPLDDDSGSDAAFSPSPPYDFSEHSQSSLPSVDAASEPSSLPNQGSPCSAAFSMSPSSSSVSSPLSVILSPNDPVAEFLHQQHLQQHHREVSGQHHQSSKRADSLANNSRKKTKPKTQQPKARTIKFHEYRGPPNAPKNSTTTPSPVASVGESSELWLQQQQLFLRLQQECMQNSHTQTPVPQHTNGTLLQKSNGDQIVQTTPATSQSQQLFDSPNSPQKLLSNFEDLKVTDLRAELKKKGLPVSGSKPQLIQRLRSHAVPSSSGTPPPQMSTSSSSQPNDTLDGILEQQQSNAIPGVDEEDEMSADQIRGLLDTMSADASAGDDSLSNEDIVQLQQIWIEKLQRDLERSRKQLQQCQIPSVPSPQQPASAAKPSTSLPKAPTPEPAAVFKTEESAAENKAAQRQIIHQILQQKIQQQELQKAQQQRQQGTINPSPSTNANSTLTALLKSSPLNASPLDLDLTPKVDLSPAKHLQDSKREVLTTEDFPTITLQPVDSPMDSGSQADDDYPGVMPIFVCHADTKATVLSPPNALSNRSSSLPSFSALLTKPPPVRSNTEPQFQLARPPPNYNEATRQMKVKQQHLTPDGSDGNPRQSKKHKSSIKSQAVDDVLEILINNGELSPSAAQDPITPVSLSSDHQSSLPLFTTAPTPHEPFFKPSLQSPTSAKATDVVQIPQSLLSPTPSNNDIEIQLAQPFFAKSNLALKDSDLQSILAANKKIELPHAFFSKPSSLKLTHNGAKEIDLRLAQSLMDLTPPSSTGFADAGCGAPSSNSLDFDFPLDMTDIDAMELDGLDAGHQTTSLDPALSEVKPVDFGMGGKSADLANHIMRLTEMGDVQDRINERGIDNDIIEFLGDFEETSGHSSANFHNSSSFGMTHDNDPLFSNGLDFFAGDDLDFKPHHDLSFMPWGENTT